MLRATLVSLMWQLGDHDFEVIIIDNNSLSENPDEVYHEFFGLLELYLIKQPKLTHTFSLCRARNTALKLARFPWIISLDADIVLNTEYLNHLKAIVNKEESLIITSERVFIDGSQAGNISVNDPAWPARQKSVLSPSNYYLQTDRRIDALKNLKENPHPWAYMHGSNTVFPREKALMINGYNEAYDGHWGYEDVDFAYRLITEKNVMPTYCPGMYCYHLDLLADGKEESRRFDKKNNPNWTRICETIPGFKEFKELEYKKISGNIQF